MLRTVVIENPGHLFVRNRQLMIRKNGDDLRVGSFEDIGWLLLEHPQITMTQSVMALASLSNTLVIFCDDRFFPCSIAMPMEGNTQQGERQRWQFEAPMPRQKQLWKQIIQMKISTQAGLLNLLNKDATPVAYLIKKVRSGDPDNIEAIAARRYWPLLMGEMFRRERTGSSPNALLNYGYAILRSCAVRMLVATGLHPGLGVHHRNKYNSFSLADDIMEPFRPWVDRIVWSLMIEEGLDVENLTSEIKKALLEVVQHDVQHGSEIRPLSNAMRHLAFEVGQYMGGKIERLSPVRIVSLNPEEAVSDVFEMD